MGGIEQTFTADRRDRNPGCEGLRVQHWRNRKARASDETTIA